MDRRQGGAAGDAGLTSRTIRSRNCTRVQFDSIPAKPNRWARLCTPPLAVLAIQLPVPVRVEAEVVAVEPCPSIVIVVRLANLRGGAEALAAGAIAAPALPD